LQAGNHAVRRPGQPATQSAPVPGLLRPAEEQQPVTAYDLTVLLSPAGRAREPPICSTTWLLSWPP